MEIHIDERRKGRGFMKKVKDRWDNEFPEFKEFTPQNLNDNARRFKEEQEIINLVFESEQKTLLQKQNRYKKMMKLWIER